MEQHAHCISCINQRCIVKPEPGFSCDFFNCPLLCGAVFHSCKVDEHQLLCPLMKVQCPNSNYGCPAILSRNKIPAHLDVCPAGVVFCTKSWNLHPACLLDSRPDRDVESMLEEIRHHRYLGIALEDCQALFETIEELGMTDLAREDPVIDKERKAIQLALKAPSTHDSTLQFSSSQSISKGLQTEEDVSEINSFNELFKAKAETARSSAAGLNIVSSTNSAERNLHDEYERDVLLKMSMNNDGSTDTLNKNTTCGPLIGETESRNSISNAPKTPQMILPVHVSQGVAGRLVLDDEVMLHPGNLKPKMMHQLNCPYKGHGQSPLSNGQSEYRLGADMEDKAVDTWDLKHKVQTEISSVSAALLACSETHKDCRGISDTVYTDYRVHFGTQTFRNIPRTSPVVCGQSLRRDQFSSHYRNIHCDFHPNFCDRIESRCPLAMYGCRFSQQRLYPSAQGARVVYHKQLKAFVIQPCISLTSPIGSRPDQFSGLPIEILWHIAGFLDSFSLCQLSLVSRTMREVCASLLPSRGIVELQWERGHFPGRPHDFRWQVKNKVWKFSPSVTPVHSWGFLDVPSVSDHMNKCPFFSKSETKSEPIPLTAMCTEQDRLSILDCLHSLRHVTT
ncbi:PREDICTED: F-box only protein 30-like [Cyprinodon variegatus]|uniref:F-box protein 30b n=1 Tax=Cyprinodon variegatus TaxID=28743 RepID=A0A3Q2CLZ3_CYPVA|nr:PREDICTED: F-box only protein 30-like [Cyprinodon variegatus]